MSDEIKKFWDRYEADGIRSAVEYVKEISEGNLDYLKDNVPALVEEARERNVDMISFLEALDEVETEDAAATSDDAGELPSDSSDPVGESEDADESAGEGAADNEEPGNTEG